MSWRRSLSFKSSEKDLKDYYDKNGGSDFAKEAMRYYIKNKNKPLPDDMKIEILKLIGNNSSTGTHPVQNQLDQKGKMGKLFK